ncbi:MAG TPA: VIT1/CCC1 family protein [Bacilli bacterium]|nr:VIT1/CCC1 family protein [Bacilli bacterium]
MKTSISKQTLSPKTMDIVLKSQQGEVTESIIYSKIARRCKDEKNRAILEKISREEKQHGEVWKQYSNQEVKPDRRKIRKFTFISRLFGFTFALRLMENGEHRAQGVYDQLSKEIPEAKEIERQEEEHENELLSMLDEERLQYVGAIVLGLNDALVELTGALAGFTIAYGTQIKLISLSGLITGLAAAFSMAASAFLSADANEDKNARKSAVYTGIAYLITVILLILPYLIFGWLDIPYGQWYALGIMLAVVVSIIALFNYYISVAKNLKFAKRFFQMMFISLGVAAFSFLIGLLVKQVFGISL